MARCGYPLSLPTTEAARKAEEERLAEEVRMAGLDQEWRADPNFGRVPQLVKVDLLLHTDLAMVYVGHGHLGGQTGDYVPVGQANSRGRLGEGGQGAKPDAEKEEGAA